MNHENQINKQRRFGGLNRLYGNNALDRLANAHVLVAGIGGVGSWCAEALARSGLGQISLVDLDHVAESNINRQVHALTATLGRAKIQAMAERIQQINPDCKLNLVDNFVDPDNVSDIFKLKPDVVIDCTDQVPAKIAMILTGKQLHIPVLVCGGAGGKTDPMAMRSGDISLATHDALLSRMRNILRKQHNYPKSKTHKKTPPKMGVWTIWFAQETILPDLWQSGVANQDNVAPQGLSCAGYGSIVTITATMGFAAASQALRICLQ